MVVCETALLVIKDAQNVRYSLPPSLLPLVRTSACSGSGRLEGSAAKVTKLLPSDRIGGPAKEVQENFEVFRGQVCEPMPILPCPVVMSARGELTTGLATGGALQFDLEGYRLGVFIHD